MQLKTVIGREVFKNGFCQRGACHRLKAAPRSRKALCARELAGGIRVSLHGKATVTRHKRTKQSGTAFYHAFVLSTRAFFISL